MISRFFPKSGNAQNAVDYLLDKKKHATLLRGNPSSFITVVDTLDFKNTYTSGVLRFNETLEQIIREDIMDKYSEFLTAGLNDPPEIVWVLHQEHGEDEMHFVVPNIDLQSSRYFQPYAHKRDLPCRDALDGKINAQYKLTDPKDPSRKRLKASAADYLKNSKNNTDLKNLIDEHIEKCAIHAINIGQTYNRTMVIQDLEKLGFKIYNKDKERNKSISVIAKSMQKQIRLKGAYYESDFRFNQENARQITTDIGNYRREIEERYKRHDEQYKHLLEKRIGRVKHRYGASWRRTAKRVEQDKANTMANNIYNNRNSIVSSSVSIHLQHIEQNGRNRGTDKYIQPSRQDGDQSGGGQNLSFAEWGNKPRRVSQTREIHTLLPNKVIPCLYKGRKIGEIIDKGNKLVAIKFKSVNAQAYHLIKQIKEKKGWQRIETNSNDAKFFEYLYHHAKQAGIELTAKNKTQEKLLARIKENDRIRNNAVKSVESFGQRTGGYQGRLQDFKRQVRHFDEYLGRRAKIYQGRLQDFKRQVGRFDGYLARLKINREKEFETFKTDVNLVEYAQKLGFKVVKDPSNNRSYKLKKSRVTIIIYTDTNDHWIYFNVKTNRSGTIIDFAQDEGKLSLRDGRKNLRSWIGRSESSDYPKPVASEKSAVTTQKNQVVRGFEMS